MEIFPFMNGLNSQLNVYFSMVVASGLGICGYLDVKQTGYESWFKGLRIVLTTVAIVSLLSTLILSYILETKTVEKKPKDLLESDGTTIPTI